MENLMATPLQELIQAIAQAQDETDLRQPVLTKIGQYFAARRWNLWFMNQAPVVDANTPDIIKRALSLEHNPVLRYVVQRHTAVHDEMILPPGVWQTICPRADHGHVMVGPIVSQGQLVGGLGITRHRHDPAFNADNLADLSALCLHFSERLATLRSQQASLPLNCASLTPREAQIAELVAQGFTNREIGAQLWITENSVKQALKRMFRKLEVASRAEMVAQLSVKSASVAAKTTSV